jgi:two-component system, sensor histidine kinase and response regulator
VLMDIQMPDMDGLTATGAIRAAENGNGQRVPIIAMTAHAMKGDHERCLEAGMDGYVSKPIRPEKLYEAIQAALGKTLPTIESADRAVSADLDDHDAELAPEVAEAFLEEAPRLLKAIRCALTEGKAAGELASAAHALKGAAAQVGASAVSLAAATLEARGRAGDLKDAPRVLAQLQTALDRFLSRLSDRMRGQVEAGPSRK